MCLLLDKHVTAGSVSLSSCRNSESLSPCVVSRMESQAVSIQFGAS